MNVRPSASEAAADATTIRGIEPAPRAAIAARSYRGAALVAVAAIGLAALYAWRLADAPIYLSHDEVLFALHAQAIAATGHDLNGRLLPLYFQITSNYWAQPFVVYATAASLAFLPLAE